MARSESDNGVSSALADGDGTTGGLQLERKKVLYLGSGGDRNNPAPHVFPDFEVVALDADESCNPDVLLDMCKLKELPADSFDGVASSHSLEHVFEHQVPIVLEGVMHVLKRNGQVFFAVPDIKKAARFLADHDYDEHVYISPAGPIRALDMLYGYSRMIANGCDLMGHKTGFTPKSMQDALERAGFIHVNIETGPLTWVDIHATGRKP